GERGVELGDDLPGFVAVRAAADDEARTGGGGRVAGLRVRPIVEGDGADAGLAAREERHGLDGAGELEERVGLAREDVGVSRQFKKSASVLKRCVNSDWSVRTSVEWSFVYPLGLNSGGREYSLGKFSLSPRLFLINSHERLREYPSASANYSERDVCGLPELKWRRSIATARRVNVGDTQIEDPSE